MAPLLSIGMIFKNEERCLERCLKSLEPLRKAIPCEVVMADTGATDNSRAIAERYADEVFDFEWINDFAAARNAVMDRCHGKWYFSIDCDEWLDEDIRELAAFVKGRKKSDFAFLTIRNYFSNQLESGGPYTDFYTARLVRMSTGQRYHGVIHETWTACEPIEWLTHTILHHDGYFFEDPEAKKKKEKRNMTLLRKQLAEEPEDLTLLLQCIDSGSSDENFVQYIRRAVEIVKEGKYQPLNRGVCALCHAVGAALSRELPELEEWLSLAQTRFPDSVFTTVDINHMVFMSAYQEKEWEKAVRSGEGYRKGIQRLKKDPRPKDVIIDLAQSTLKFGSPDSEYTLLICLADAYCQTGQGEKALAILTELKGEELSSTQVRNATVSLCQLYAQTDLEVSPALTTFYEQISQKEPTEQKRRVRLAAFNEIAAAAFASKYRREEQKKDGFRRPAYTAFAVLCDKCEAGRAAKLMTASDPAEMKEWLLKVEDWQALPIEALEHAISAGLAFPLREMPLNMEVLDGLAARLTHGSNMARQLALSPRLEGQSPSDLQDLFWAQSLALAALRSFDWTLGKTEQTKSKFFCPEKKEDTSGQQKPPGSTVQDGLILLRRFAEIESVSLPALYAPQMLTEQNAALLPPMHRWGFYCAQAFRALDQGKSQEYLAALRKALNACPGQKEIVQFLLDRFLEDSRPQASPELLELAERIRAILAAYSPDDPAVAAIRQSPAYQQVAWLIEDSPSHLLQ